MEAKGKALAFPWSKIYILGGGKMKAMIMAAGVGSRLMPMTTNIPKPMIPVLNKPLMENTIKLLQEHDIIEIIANLHYKAEVIKEYFKEGSDFGVQMEYSSEEVLLGTAGGVKKCAFFLDDTFVIVSGDALTDVDLSSLLKEHKRKGALATIALKEVEEVEHFGVVITDEDGKIKRFQEKPRAAEALSKDANTGIYIFEPEIFKYIPNRQFYDFGKQVFPHLVKIGAPFYGVKINQYWCDVGNINTYRQVHTDILKQKVRAIKTGGRILENTEGATVFTGDDITIGKNVKWDGNVVIGKGCYIADNVYINDSVIWDYTYIGENSVINGAIIGENCRVGNSVHINSGAAIVSNCTVDKGTGTLSI